MFVSIGSKLISFMFVVITNDYIKITIKTCQRNKRTPRSSFICYFTADIASTADTVSTGSE